MTDIRRLFEREMRALQEEGAQFAKDFPEAARFLDREGVDDRDPYVERVIEATAFLTARIREEMEGDGDPLAELILEQIAPELRYPLPSVAVVEFAMRQEAAQALTLSEGVQILSEPIPDLGAQLVFELSHPVEVDRSRVAEALVGQDERGNDHLELELAWDDFDPAPAWPNRIDLYLHGDGPVVWAMRFALLRRVAEIEIFADNSWHVARGVAFEGLDQPCFTADGMPPSPFAQARDYLGSDERFRFVRIGGLDATGIRIPDTIRLRVRFKGAMPRGWARSVKPELFRPHVGVVVNRFRDACEPVVWDHTRIDMVLRAQGGQHREILEIESVRGFLPQGGGPERIYHRHGLYRHDKGGGFFQLRNGLDSNGRIVAKLSIGYPDAKNELQEEFMAVDAICCDGQVPNERLRPEALNRLRHEAAARLLVTGVKRPTSVYRPAAGTDKSRLLALAAGHSEGWLDAARLKDGLRHVSWDPSDSKRTLIEAIQDVRAEDGQILIKGVGWRQMRVSIRMRDTTCTPETWDRLGQIDAFGSVLWAIVREQIPIGSIGRLELVIDPAGVRMDWES